MARQQALLDAWHELRDRARREGTLDGSFLEFEVKAAERLASTSEELRAGTWRPLPVRAVPIPKPSGGERVLGIPPLRDRIVERALLNVLDPIIDPELLPWSFAYRRGLGVQDALRALLDAREEGFFWVVRGDFSACFDEIPRARLLDRVRQLVPDAELLELIRLLVYRPVAGAEGSAPKGLHQGSALSPILANLYLDSFDRAMLRRGFRVIRYADDFAIPLERRDDGEEALRAARQEAVTLGLDLSGEKCSVRSFEEGVPFLGEVLTAATAMRPRRQGHPLATTVYVTEEGSLLRSRGSRLRVERGDELLFSIDFRRVRQVVLLGRIGMTTAFLHQVLARGIDVVLIGGEGRYIGRLQPAAAANPFVRHAQFAALMDRQRSHDLRRRIVRGKITNLRAGLLRAARRGEPALDQTVERLERIRARCADAEGLEALLGFEGAATREYFLAFGRLLGEAWTFLGRRRRPPPDPVNALLSFGYTLLLNDAIAALETAGLDPYSGFLHQARVGRPSLALDLIEEFRPLIVDSVVLRALRSGALRPADFVTDPGPPVSCRCDRAGLKAFIAMYERRMLTLFTHPSSGRRVSYRVGLFLQARALADELLDPVRRYEPLVWK